jgi:putative nucleotidyltransferase with HDIG domain
MRPIALSDITGGEMVARAVQDEDGRVLVAKGVAMKLSFLNRLKEKGVTEIFIEDEISEGIYIEEVVSMETKLDVKRILKAETQRLIKSKDISIGQLNKAVDMITKELEVNRKKLLNMRDYRMNEDFLLNHSINVSILAILMTQQLDGSYDKVSTIGVGCLLHDIGKLTLPKEVLDNEFVQNEAHFKEFQKHTTAGYNLLKDRFDIRPISRIILLQHHENIDGSGYPKGLKGHELHFGSKICRICDAFDSMMSMKVVDKTVNTAYAIEFLNSLTGSYFEKEYVEELLFNIPVFQNGTVVILSNQMVGIVSQNDRNNLTRPKIRVFYDLHRKQKTQSREIDLMKELNVRIDRELGLDVKELLT